MWVEIHDNKFALLQLIAFHIQHQTITQTSHIEAQEFAYASSGLVELTRRHFIGDITNRHEATSTHIVTKRDIMVRNGFK